jgi:riboflavin synthase
MFTGIVEEVGAVRAIKIGPRVATLEIDASVTVDGTDIGGSIAVNGVCLTVVQRRSDGFVFEVGPETLSRTALARLGTGDRVNLERPLRFGGALGGHLVLGHVDGVGTVNAVTRVESTARVRITLPGRELEPLLIPQGSVAVDGVSLTVAALGDLSFEVMLIPHTLAVTTLGRLEPGQATNIEVDVIGKYLVRSLALRGMT